MEKTWTTKEGEVIKYKDLEQSHLLNIQKYILMKARKGVVIYYGDGHDPDSFDIEIIYGKEVLDYLDYKGICDEIDNRISRIK